MNWKYDIACLGWVNDEGLISETDPAEKITLSGESVEKLRRSYAELPLISAALAYRRLWPDNEEAIRQAFLIMLPTGTAEEVERVIRRTRG